MSTGSSAPKPLPTDTVTEEQGARRPLGEKLAWFVALWIAGLVVAAGAAFAMKALLGS